ncbi:hypothetical protein OEZ86_006351 [Tetradesmus obliquus]|nr:hypothetical protein OEZ86_006351 [Tetradesmus obliquus]
MAGETGPPEAGTGQVFPEQYDQQLQAKLAHVRELFAGQQLPEVEVFRSSPEHFRMRTEFRVWLQQDEAYYVMFEKNERSGGPDDAGQAGEAQPISSDTEQPAAATAAAEANTKTTAVAAEADAGARAAADEGAASDASQPAADAEQQPKLSSKQRRKLQRKRGKKAAKAAAAADDAKTRRFNRVRIDEFPVASQLICELMVLLRKELIAHPVLRDKVFQANFHSTLSKQAMVTLVYRRPLDDVWQEAAHALRSRLLKALGPEACSQLHIVGRSRKQKLCVDADHVFERMEVAGRSYEYMQVEGAFSQPNGGVCQHMLNWAVESTKGSSGDLLELYCGNGNFTIPLAQNFKQVVATEVSKASVAAARHNIAANAADNVFLARMSSEEFTETWKVKGTRNRLAGLDWEQLSLDTLFVDPPRAGLDPATEQMLQDFEQVVYISCNPETLAKNLRSVAHSHDIVRMAVFDQFPYTEHIEAGVVIRRKPSAAAV